MKSQQHHKVLLKWKKSLWSCSHWMVFCVLHIFIQGPSPSLNQKMGMLEGVSEISTSHSQTEQRQGDKRVLGTNRNGKSGNGSACCCLSIERGWRGKLTNPLLPPNRSGGHPREGGGDGDKPQRYSCLWLQKSWGSAKPASGKFRAGNQR